MSYLGGDEFRAWAYRQRLTEEEAVSHQERAAFRPSMDEIIEKVASRFEVSRESVVRTTRGGSHNVPCWVAMYLCQEVGGCRLVEITSYFGLKRTGSIPTAINKLKQLMNQDETLMRMPDELK
jgi:chromosomal replication initiation ATPase DnaA